MNRRTFIHSAAVMGGAGIIGFASTSLKGSRENASIEWIVKGFSCPTCAVGLETLLGQQNGVARVSAEYPSGRVRIGFDSNVISSSSISELIGEMGFQVAS